MTESAADGEDFNVENTQQGHIIHMRMMMFINNKQAMQSVTDKIQYLPGISWFALHALFGWFCVVLFEGTSPLKNGLFR